MGIKKWIALLSLIALPAAAISIGYVQYSSDGLAPESMRSELASGIIKRWASEANAAEAARTKPGNASEVTWEDRVLPRLQEADIANLERAASAPTFDAMNAELVGALNVPAGTELVYTPLTPCRIIDTRLAGGPIAANGTRSFIAYSPTTFAVQGGDNSNCNIPPEVSALTVKITATNTSENGYFTVYPTNEPRPFASSLNYFGFGNTSDESHLKLCRPSCATQFAVFSDHQADVVVDVTGYFAERSASALDCTIAQQAGTLDLLSGIQNRSVSCPAGYAATGGGCGTILGVSVSNSAPLAVSGYPAGWQCDMVGSLLSAVAYNVNAVCCRTSGR